MKIYVGCSGWNYKDWREVFYPEKLPKKDWLSFYAEKFNSVEVNNTFYRLPKDEHVKNWKTSVASDFKFTLKGSRYVTQMKKLKETEDSVKLFQEKSAILNRNLGCILWQLPPNLHRNDERLKMFCENLDARKKHVIEFRHTSWFTEEVYKILEDNKIGFCSISSPDFPEEFISTSNFGYLRFHGKGKKWYDYDYSDDELKEWIAKITPSKIDQLFVYFNNDIGANAPKNALRFRELIEKNRDFS